MPQPFEKPASLALEIMPSGLSLITHVDDTPLECLAHAALDDPAFDEKVDCFRDSAEAALGKGFKTQIWLSDEHLRLHCAMLRSTNAAERRKEAASALSAMSPFHVKDLCFDLGATDSEGYTPIAAIPKEKMDDALAFARKLKLNPEGVTTSDDLVGFAHRPSFAPLEDAKPSALPARVAGFAALAAVPFIGWNGGWFDGHATHTGATQQVAFIATVAPVEKPSETLKLTFPGMEDAVTRPEIHRDNLVAPASHVPVRTPDDRSGSLTVQFHGPQIADLSGGEMVSLRIETKRLDVTLSRSSGASLPRAAMPDGVKPMDPLVQHGAATVMQAPAETTAPVLRVSALASPDHLAAPRRMFQGTQTDWRDGKPRISRDRSEPSGLMNVRPAAARDFENPAMPGPTGRLFLDGQSVRVANIGEGVLVTKPARRTREVVLQPSFAPIPPPRPGAKLPEEAFDFSSLVPMTTVGEGSTDPFTLPEPLATAPRLSAHLPVVAVDADQPVHLTDELRQFRIEQAEKRAGLAPEMKIAPPLRRDAVPVAPGEGTIVQTSVASLFGAATPGVDNAPTQPVPADIVPGFLAATRLSALSLDTEMKRAAEPVDPLAGAAELARPPVRPQPEVLVDARPDPAPETAGPSVAPDADQLVLEELAVPDGVAAQTESQPEDQAQAAIDAPDLRLPQPPRRPDLASAGEVPEDGAIAEAEEFLLPQPPRRPTSATTVEVAAEPLDPENAPAGEIVFLAGIAAANAADPLRLPNPPRRPVADQADVEPAQVAGEPDDAAQPETPETVAEIAASALALPRPPTRPKSAELLAALDPDDAEFASPQAVPIAVLPIARPADFAARAARIAATRRQAATPIVTTTPGETTSSNALHLPSSAEVARTATIENGINLGGVSLIGIFGTANARRALVRLPQGRYVQVKRGDRVRGWTVSAISEDSIRVQNGSKNSILRMPK